MIHPCKNLKNEGIPESSLKSREEYKHQPHRKYFSKKDRYNCTSKCQKTKKSSVFCIT